MIFVSFQILHYWLYFLTEEIGSILEIGCSTRQILPQYIAIFLNRALCMILSLIFYVESRMDLSV